jgi:hypothetical protein
VRGHPAVGAIELGVPSDAKLHADVKLASGLCAMVKAPTQ